MGVRSRVVRLHIGELVLEGIAPGERRGVGEAVQRELARLIAEQGMRSSIESQRNIDAGSFTVTHPRLLGSLVANQIFRGLDR